MLRTLALALIVAAASAQEPRVDNVVFFLVDDLGFADVSPFHPGTFYETPNIQRLADTGMRFTQAYAASPVCSPTRASILSGKNPARLHATQWFGGPQPERTRANAGYARPLHPAAYVGHLALGEETIAEVLRDAGLATWFGGKWHLGGEGFGPLEQGFAVNVGGDHRGHPPSYFSPYRNALLADGPDGELLTTRLASEAVDFIERRTARDTGFLVYLSFYAVHTPLQAEPAAVAAQEARRAARPALTDAERFGTEGDRKVRLVQDHAVYAAMVAAMDRAVGAVLDALDRSGAAADTLVVFCSDNGGLSTSEGHPTSNLPLRAGKGWLYEGGIRVPCIARWPGVTAAGSECSTPIISHDWYPTILTATGQRSRPDQHVDGRDLTPLLRGAPPEGERALFWHYPHYSNQGGVPGGAVRRGRFKLIEDYASGRVELYDLAADVGERQDLAAAHPELAARMRAELHAWLQGVGARMPTANPRR